MPLGEKDKAFQLVKISETPYFRGYDEGDVPIVCTRCSRDVYVQWNKNFVELNPSEPILTMRRAERKLSNLNRRG